MFEGLKEFFKKPEETIGDKKEKGKEELASAIREGKKIKERWEEERKEDPTWRLEQK